MEFLFKRITTAALIALSVVVFGLFWFVLYNAGWVNGGDAEAGTDNVGTDGFDDPIVGTDDVGIDGFDDPMVGTDDVGNGVDHSLIVVIAVAATVATGFCGGIGAARQHKNFFKGIFIRIALGALLCPLFGVGIVVAAGALQQLGVDIISVDLISEHPTTEDIFSVISSYGYITSMWVSAVTGL